MFTKEKYQKSEKAAKLFRKSVFQIKLKNKKEGAIILSTGEILVWISSVNFCSKRLSLVFQLFAYIYITYLTNIIDKILRSKLSTLTVIENSKAEKRSWVKKTKKADPKRKERLLV